MAKQKIEFNQAGSAQRGEEHTFNLSEKLAQNFGGGAAMPLSHAAVARFRKLPTGLLYVDRMLNGGITFGRVTALWGRPSSFKTTCCLGIVRSAQHYCRYCKSPIWLLPDTGELECWCPEVRYKVEDPSYHHWLTLPQAKAIATGNLPEGAKKGKGGRYYVVAKKPAGSKVASDKAQKNAKKEKVDVYFEETFRCEPLRILFIDSERSLDESWCVANGVNPASVTLVGASWSEQTFDMLDEALASYEDDGVTPVVDLVVIDSMSMLTPRETLEKSHEDTPKIAVAASAAKRAVEKWVMAMHAPGLASTMAPTIVLTFQVSTQFGPAFSYLGPSGMSNKVHHAAIAVLKYDVKKWHPKNEWADIQIGVEKNKSGGAGKGAKVMVRFRVTEAEGKPIGDSQDVEILVRAALEHSVGVTQTSSKIVFELPGAQVEFSSQKAFVAWLQDNRTIYLDLRARTLAFLIEGKIELPAQAGLSAPKDDPAPVTKSKKPQPIVTAGTSMKALKASIAEQGETLDEDAVLDLGFGEFATDEAPTIKKGKKGKKDKKGKKKGKGKKGKQ